MTAPLAVLNIERIGWSALKAHARHERREIGDRSHTDPSRAHLNRWVGLDACPETAARKYLKAKGAKIDKRNEKPFTRLLLSASPSYFRPGREDEAGVFDRERTQAWVKASVKWLRKEFGSDAVHIAYHADETTIHLHALVVPTYTKQTKRRRTVQVSHHKHPAFSQQSYATCHDRYAAMVRDLGIERGERLPPGATKKRSTTKREWLANGLRRLRSQARRVLVERIALDAERESAMPALEAARMVAERQKDPARVAELVAHIRSLRGPVERSRGRSR